MLASSLSVGWYIQLSPFHTNMRACTGQLCSFLSQEAEEPNVVGDVFPAQAAALPDALAQGQLPGHAEGSEET